MRDKLIDNVIEDEGIKQLFGELSNSVPEPKNKELFKKDFLAMVDEAAMNSTAQPSFKERLVLKFVKVAVAATASFTILGGLAYASSGSLPGSPLYPVKKLIEATQAAVSVTPQAKAHRNVDIMEARLKELSKIKDSVENRKYIARQLNQSISDLLKLQGNLNPERKARAYEELKEIIKKYRSQLVLVKSYLTPQSLEILQNPGEEDKENGFIPQVEEPAGIIISQAESKNTVDRSDKSDEEKVKGEVTVRSPITKQKDGKSTIRNSAGRNSSNNNIRPVKGIKSGIKNDQFANAIVADFNVKDKPSNVNEIRKAEGSIDNPVNIRNSEMLDNLRVNASNISSQEISKNKQPSRQIGQVRQNTDHQYVVSSGRTKLSKLL